jgi:hypothetical protein
VQIAVNSKIAPTIGLGGAAAGQAVSLFLHWPLWLSLPLWLSIAVFSTPPVRLIVWTGTLILCGYSREEARTFGLRAVLPPSVWPELDVLPAKAQPPPAKGQTAPDPPDDPPHLTLVPPP